MTIGFTGQRLGRSLRIPLEKGHASLIVYIYIYINIMYIYNIIK